MTKQKINFKIIIFLVVLALAVFIAEPYITKAVKQRNKYICTQFKTQEEAQRVYVEEGATYLDSNGDGIACNSLEKIPKH